MIVNTQFSIIVSMIIVKQNCKTTNVQMQTTNAAEWQIRKRVTLNGW